MDSVFLKAPIIVGGVGGSGTRLIADILESFDVYMGRDLNRSNDNMLLARKFFNIRELVQINNNYTKEINKLSNNQINTILNTFIDKTKKDKLEKHYKTWGWKVPGNFLILNQYDQVLETYKYIHVIRHGLDMAYSQNQNQVMKWGRYFKIDIDNLSIPQASFKYWLKVNNYVNIKCLRNKNIDYYLLNFDQLITNPKFELIKLQKFLGYDDVNIDNTISLIKRPKTIGRHRKHDINIFDEKDLFELCKFGFSY